MKPHHIKAALFILLLSMLLFALSCEDEQAHEAKGKIGLPAAAADLDHPLATHQKEKYTDDLSVLLERRFIRVLTSFNKTNFFLSGGEIYGFEYSLLKDYEKFINRKIKRNGLRVVVEFIPVARDMLMPALLDGLGDIAAAGLTVTPERLRRVDFTEPYMTGIDEVIVTSKKVRGLNTLENLSGKRIYVRKSSSYHESLLSLNERLSEKGLRPVRIVMADETLETEDILEMVDSGALEMTVADSHIADIWSRVFEDMHVFESLKIRKGGEIAWMVRKDNPGLKASLNEFIKGHRRGTLIGNIYFNRYFKDNRRIRNPFGKNEDDTHRRYEKLFKKYAARYGFDWVLIKALAYQESNLSNKKRNPSGAVGILQVRPQTASDRNVGIKDVHLLENNIHAGVKYLAFLRDRYFSDEDIRERDRVRLSLAAYNAGPAKVRRARALAGKMGLNPNRWFRNVEMATLKSIGQETVRYVSNINKYYVIFSLAAGVEKRRSEAKGLDGG
jgi:membrane-bound lytic murein transglycosylase MltF